MGLLLARWTTVSTRVGTAIALTATSYAQTPARVELERELANGRVDGIEHVTASSGGVFVWVESAQFDPRLRVSFEGEGELSDDDTGGGTSAWVRRACTAGVRLAISVDSKDASASGRARIVVQEMPDTEESRRASAACLEALREAEAIAARGDRTAAAALLREAALGLTQAAGVEFDADAHGSLWKAQKKLDEWDDTPSSLAIGRVLVGFVRAHYPPASRAVVQQLNGMCGCLMTLNRGEEALPWCEESVATATRAFGESALETAIARFNFSMALCDAHRLERARIVGRQAIDAIERLRGTNDAMWAAMAGQYGIVLKELGELDGARRVEERALEVLARLADPTDGQRMSLENNLAATLDSLGDSRAALEMHASLAARNESLYGREHPTTRLSRHNMAVCRLKLGETDSAIEELTALAVSYRDEETDSEAATLGDAALADALIRRGRYAEALELALARREKRARDGHDDAAGDWRVATAVARALAGLGRREEAARAAERTLECAKLAFPPEHPDLAESRLVAARLELELGRRDGAFTLATEAAEDAIGYFALCATTLSMRQAEAVQEHWSRLVSDGLTLLAATAPDSERVRAANLAFELTESARGIGTALPRIASASTSDEIERQRATVRDAARDVSRLGARSSNPAEVTEAVARKESAERALRAALAGVVGEGWARLRSRASEVVASLGSDEALIAFWRHDVRALESPPDASRVPRMLAFVARRGGALQLVDLGPLEPISAAVSAWRGAANSGDTAPANAERDAGENLRALVLDPLRAHLGDAKRWRVASDDALHLVALDALPNGEARIGDSVLVTNAVALAMPRRADSLIGPAKLVAVGGVDYEVAEPLAGVSAASIAALDARALRGGPWESGFAELWETQREVEDVAALFRATHSDSRVALLVERAATKRELIVSAASATFLHVATHGFCAIGERGDDSHGLAQRSPLALCGLALAGANAGPDSNGFDGVITAEELAALDLSRCELVVLSACDTNVGRLSAGQGVASFQKALHAAGARVVVTSLWKVSDESTRALMASFYAALWRDGQAPEAALWSAKRALRERRAPVRDWAGWILSRP